MYINGGVTNKSNPEGNLICLFFKIKLLIYRVKT